ncbi:MAG: UDP-glucose 4-epimerase GalE [Brooklawnia sp.]|jgi:UDP-glucose 4-epimerase
MSVMVVGGAGYIGAHVVRMLRADGHEVVVVDDLSNSTADRVAGVHLLQLDISAARATDQLAAAITSNGVDAVIHFAARKQVGESVERPMYYYRQNVGGLTNLLEAMAATSTSKIIFSSSAAVYGAPDDPVVTEDSPTNPVNPYGRTKLIGEWMLADAQRAWGLNWMALRYFNVAGAAWPELGDPVVMNLVPMVLDRLARGQAPRIFGADYDTPDGTCIRDYVHVGDLARAHIVALQGLDTEPPHRVYNVGTGTGTSVRQIIEAVGRACGMDATPVIEPRRPGDPPKLIASADRISTDLGFTATAGVDQIVESAWAAWQARAAY